MTSGGVDIDTAALAARADEVRASARRIAQAAAGLEPLASAVGGVIVARAVADIADIIAGAGRDLLSALAATADDLAGRLELTAESYARVEDDAASEVSRIRRETSS